MVGGSDAGSDRAVRRGNVDPARRHLVAGEDRIAVVEDDRTLRAEQPDLRYFIRADESRPYGEVMGIMRVARAAGIENVSLVTLPEG